MASISVKEVAAHAGVSIGTVSNVLNHPEKVLDTTVDRVRRSIRELGFSRNDAARQLGGGRSQVVGLVLFQAANPFFADISTGADRVAAERGFTILQGDSGQDPDRESTFLDVFEQQRVRGVLMAPAEELANRGQGLRRRGIPLVLVDRSGDDLHSSVSVDDVMGGRLAVEHLLSSGRRRIAFVSSRPELRQVADRLRGATLAVAAHPDATLEVIPVGDLEPSGGHEAARRILTADPSRRPDGVFTVNDLVAIGLLHTLLAAGVSVPNEVGVVGYDDIDFAADSIVPLTSVRRPGQAIGAEAMHILLEESDRPDLPPRERRFQPELIVRASSIRESVVSSGAS